MDIAPLITTPTPLNQAAKARELELREVAKAFESTFLAEMLKASGLGKTRSEFGGGAGEDAFGSMMVDEQARLMTERGGIGLSEHIFNNLWAKEFGND